MPILASIGAGSARGLGFTSGSSEADFDYLVLAGGGGGGVSPGGGGGAGGHRTSFPGGTKTTIKSGQTITVGGGGNGGYVPAGYIPGTRGGDSSSGDISSKDMIRDLREFPCAQIKMLLPCSTRGFIFSSKYGKTLAAVSFRLSPPGGGISNDLLQI